MDFEWQYMLDLNLYMESVGGGKERYTSYQIYMAWGVEYESTIANFLHGSELTGDARL